MPLFNLLSTPLRDLTVSFHFWEIWNSNQWSKLAWILQLVWENWDWKSKGPCFPFPSSLTFYDPEAKSQKALLNHHYSLTAAPLRRVSNSYHAYRSPFSLYSFKEIEFPNEPLCWRIQFCRNLTKRKCFLNLIMEVDGKWDLPHRDWQLCWNTVIA